MPQPVFLLCTVCHYMIYTYSTDSHLSLISVLIAKTTDYIPWLDGIIMFVQNSFQGAVLNSDPIMLKIEGTADFDNFFPFTFI